jgi:tetratricopeptide (TPR) repeat protein
MRGAGRLAEMHLAAPGRRGGEMRDSIGLILVAAMLSCFLVAAPARAGTPNDDALLKRAISDLERENYEEALEELTQSWKQGPRTPEKAFYLGKVYRAQLNYRQAQKYLEEAVRLRPDYHEARMLLVDTLISLDQSEAAQKQLQQLEASGYQPAQVAYLQGLAASKQKKFSQAVTCFRQAQQDPALSQKAKMQMSLALAAQNRLDEAQKVMGEAVALGPQTQVGSYAQYYLADMDRRLKETRTGPWRINVAVGFDYDSNVTLQPGSPGAAQLVSGQGDIVYSQMGYLEYTPITRGPFSLRTSYAYYQNFHPRLSNYDVLTHIAGLTPVYTYQSGRVWLPFLFNYTDVESDKYYTAFDLNPTLLHMASPKVGVEVKARWARKYYWFPLGVPEDDRSGRTYGTSLGLYYFLKNQQGYLQAKFTYEHDNTKGGNWDNSNYRFLVAALYPVTTRLKLNTFVEYMLAPYAHRFTDGNPANFYPKRFDHIFIFGAQAGYTIYKGLEFNVHYFLVKADSNINLYSYDRHIVGCQLGYNY